jgi:hypothetical protein
MDESIDEFKQNFKLIKEKKLKLAQISKFLSPSHSLLSQANTTETTHSPDNSRDHKQQSSSKPSLSKLNETVKEAQAQVKSKSTKLKTSKSTISNYFVSPKEVSAATASKPLSSSSILTNNSFKCPLCTIDLTKLGESERQKHVNECLDKDFSNKSSKNKFKLKDDDATKRDEVKLAYEVASASNSTLTPKASTSLDGSIKVDNNNENAEERQKRLNENLLRDAVPNCPICGKVLQNMNVFILYFLFFKISIL